MSNEPTLAELKTLVHKEWEGFRSDIQATKEAEKEKIISSIISLSAESGQEIKKEEIEKSNIASLNILERQLKLFIEAKTTEDGDPSSGIVPRGGDPPASLSKDELNNTIIDMISHSFGLPVPDSDTPPKGEMSKTEYAELCRTVKMVHYSQNLRY